MINGIEHLDYSEEEHMKFVQDKYINPLLKILIVILEDDTSSDQPRRSILIRLKLHLMCYQELVAAEFDPKTNILKDLLEAKKQFLHLKLNLNL